MSTLSDVKKQTNEDGEKNRGFTACPRRGLTSPAIQMSGGAARAAGGSGDGSRGTWAAGGSGSTNSTPLLLWTAFSQITSCAVITEAGWAQVQIADLTEKVKQIRTNTHFSHTVTHNSSTDSTVLPFRYLWAEEIKNMFAKKCGVKCARWKPKIHTWVCWMCKREARWQISN